MALRLRRGLDLDRVGVVFAEGELVYATDTKRLHIGDGVTAGGIPVGDLLGDTSPQLGATLDLNTHSIVGLGTILIDGDISSSGVIQANTIEGNFKGTFSADDSTLLIDGVNNKLVLSNNELNDFSNVNLSNTQLRQFLKWSGSEWENSFITLEDLVDVVTGGGAEVGQVLKYDGANWVPSEDLTASGNIVGDLKGSVFGDDSTVLVDSVNGFLNLSRNMLSDLHDIATDQATNNQVLAWNGVRWAPTDLGNIQLDYLTGDVKGSVFADDSTILVDAIRSTIYLDNNLLSDLSDVSYTAPLPGNVLYWAGSRWEASPIESLLFDTPTLDTDIKGSIFADDSSVIVDSVNNTLSADSVTVNFATIGDQGLYITGSGNITTAGRLEFDYNDVSSPSTVLSTVVTRDNGQQKFAIQTRPSNTYFSHDDNGVSGITMYSDYATFGGMHLRINPGNDVFSKPTDAFQVDGDATVTGRIASTFVGSLAAVDSTVVVDNNGTIVNLAFSGNVAGTPSDTVSVDSWLQVSVNGATKYIPLYA